MRTFVLNSVADVETIVNRGFEDWTGSLPDNWTKLSGATVENSTEQRIGSKCLRLTVCTSTALIYQDASPWDQFKGKTITFTCWVKTELASQSRLGLDDGVSTTYSGYHPGNGAWARLSVCKAISSSATRVRVLLESTRA
jgi:hypothetical protein